MFTFKDQRLGFMAAMTGLIVKSALGAMALLLLAACSGQTVKSEAETKTAETSAVASGGFCAPEQGAPFSYRKKVAVLAADLDNLQDAVDMPNFDRDWSGLLQQRLSESGRLLVTDASDQHLYTGERQRDWIMALAKRLDVQFVIAVRFHNLHVSRFQFGVGSYSIPLPGMQRRIDAELIIFDGYYGVPMATIHHAAIAKGDENEVANSTNQSVLRGGGFDTPLGRALNYVLNEEAGDGLKRLACLPLMARVVKASGNSFYISTPGASLIHPGDTLQLFRLSGQIEARLGAVEITKVFPESAVAVYKGGGAAPSFSEGLSVRAW